MTKETSVGVIFYYREQSVPKYLLLKYKVHGQKHWDFVKGGKEEGEGMEDTARREVREETGLEDIVFVPEFTATSAYTYKKKTGEVVAKEVVYFLSEISKDKSTKIILSEEHETYTWATFDEANSLFQFPQQKAILMNVNEFVLKRLK